MIIKTSAFSDVKNFKAPAINWFALSVEGALEIASKYPSTVVGSRFSFLFLSSSAFLLSSSALLLFPFLFPFPPPPPQKIANPLCSTVWESHLPVFHPACWEEKKPGSPPEEIETRTTPNKEGGRIFALSLLLSLSFLSPPFFPPQSCTSLQ